MRVAKNDIPVQIDVPGATARLLTDFGDVTGYSKISAEFFSLGAGTDMTELLHGLEGNLCQCPHWGYVLKGTLTTTDAANVQESVTEGDLFYWPPGHTLKADEDADIIMFSPEKEHFEVVEHIQGKLGG